jgi:hypothetical protein
MEFNLYKISGVVLVGYAVSWIYAFIAYKILAPSYGKIKAMSFAYASSWLVWLVASALLSKKTDTL